MEKIDLNRFNIQKIFDYALKLIINTLILFIIIVLIIGLFKTLFTLKLLLVTKDIELHLSHVVADILSFLVMIELFRSFVDYFKAKRIRLHSMIDPAIIFVVREIIVKLYTHDAGFETAIPAFSLLLLSLGVIRTLAVKFSPKDD
jgi:uncharacterized membrane protein (DUF373 family)